jgi:hypothetical protein
MQRCGNACRCHSERYDHRAAGQPDAAPTSAGLCEKGSSFGGLVVLLARRRGRGAHALLGKAASWIYYD